jgi:hypothetical protein
VGGHAFKDLQSFFVYYLYILPGCQQDKDEGDKEEKKKKEGEDGDGDGDEEAMDDEDEEFGDDDYAQVR